MQAIIVVVLIDLVLLLSAINASAVSVAFPNIKTYYDTSLVLAGWVLSIYSLVAACSMVIMGKVSDVLGRKNTFLICAGLFVIGSLFAAVAPNIQLLIAARLVQSIGGGGFVPAMIGIIVEIFPRHRQKAISWSMGIYPFGVIIGPTIGSWLITSFGWQTVFWFNVPVGILVIIPLIFLLKNNRREKVQIDYQGAAYFSSFLFSLLIGLSQIAHSETGLGWLITSLLFVASTCFLITFIRHEMKARDPIIDLELLRLKPFAAANFYNFIFGICIWGLASFIPLYAVSVYSMTTLQSGLVVMFRAIGSMVGSTASGFFLVKWGYRRPMLFGSIINSAGLILLGLEFSQENILGTQISPVVLVSAITLLMGLGGGVANPASDNACLGLMPTRVSTITGVRGMFRNSGAAISIAIITLTLQFIGKLSLGFTVVFISSGLIVLLTIPFILAMPDRDPRILEKKE